MSEAKITEQEEHALLWPWLTEVDDKWDMEEHEGYYKWIYGETAWDNGSCILESTNDENERSLFTYNISRHLKRNKVKGEAVVKLSKLWKQINDNLSEFYNRVDVKNNPKHNTAIYLAFAKGLNINDDLLNEMFNRIFVKKSWTAHEVWISLNFPKLILMDKSHKAVVKKK